MKKILKKGKKLLSVLLLVVIILSSMYVQPIHIFADESNTALTAQNSLPDPVFEWSFETNTVQKVNNTVYSIGTNGAAATLEDNASVEVNSEKGSDDLPDPDYYYSFEVGTFTEQTVYNQGIVAGADAVLTNNAVIETDSITDSKVAVLPGGSVGAGHIELDSDLFSGVTADTGFTLSLWMYADSTAGEYERIFTSSNGPLGQEYYGNSGSWSDPEFAFALGKDGAGQTSSVWNSALSTGEAGQTATVQCKLVWDKGITRTLWQHVVLVVTGDSYDIYLDGEKVSYTDTSDNLNEALTAFFADMENWKYNAIGQSIYTSDNDTAARIDNIRFYKNALDSAEIAALYSMEGDDYNALLTNINVDGTDITVVGGQYIYTYEVDDNPEVTVDDISVTTAVVTSTAEISAVDGEANKFQITVTSKMGVQLMYTLECVNRLDGAVLNFNTQNTEPLSQKATGFLYGLSEPNVPSIDLLGALKPDFVVQKALDGLQHPTGDGFRLESMIDAVDADYIQIYLQDMYLEWPYETKDTLEESLTDYSARVIDLLKEMQELTGDPALSKYNFVLFNEPNGIWFSGNSEGYYAAWNDLYNEVKALNSEIKCAGPTPTGFSQKWVIDFLKYADDNNCLPDVIVWHELYDGSDEGDSLVSFRSHWEQVQEVIQEYYTDQGLEEPIVVVNEYALFDDIGAGGALVPWLAMFEEAGIYSCTAYWGLANTLNELAAEANIPNSAWWLYKWYADLTGERMNVTTSNVEVDGTYGLGSIDEANKTVYAIFGGQEGTQTSFISGLAETGAFTDATSAHVKLYSTSYSGQHGADTEPYLEFEGNLALNSGGNLKIQVTDCNALDVYYAIITPATSEAITTIEDFDNVWTVSYEAEDAELLGNAVSNTYSTVNDLARSGKGDVTNILDTTDGVEYTVNVGEDGKYELKVYYSVPAPYVDPITLEVDPDGQNRAIGQVVKHQLSIDGEEMEVLTYKSTVKTGYVNYTTAYVDLTGGEHTLQLTHYGEDQSSINSNIRLVANLDKIDLTYNTDMEGEIIIPDVVIEPEEVIGDNSGYTFDNELSGCTGGGYVEGQGDFSFTVVAPEDGLYNVQSNLLQGNGSSATLYKQAIDYGKDAKSETRISTRNVTIGALSDSLQIYLTKGANTLTISSSNQIALDSIRFTYNSQNTIDKGIAIEAEAAVLSGNAEVIDNDYAFGGQMVDGITIGQDAESVEAGAVATDSSIAFEIDVEEAGTYALSMFYTNNEPAPVQERVSSDGLYVHPYNTDLVERYAQVVVNDNEPETVYFRNTFSWDMIKNVVIDVELSEGENTIVIYNDNSYKFSELVNSAAPRFDRFVFTPASINDTGDNDSDNSNNSSRHNNSSSGSTSITKGELGKVTERVTSNGKKSVVLDVDELPQH